MNLFFTSPDNIGTQELVIEGQESHHLSKVLRYRVGDSILVTDGCGMLYSCNILSAERERTVASILSREKKEEKPPHLTLCIGVIRKKDRLEFAVEKVTEIGAKQIILFYGEYSEKMRVRTERLESVILSAVKQSLSSTIPSLKITKSLEEAILQKSHSDLLVVADERSGITKKAEELPCTESAMLVVGPEGGFSQNEREFLQMHHASFITLGERRLRTETAATLLCNRFKNR